MAALHAVVRGAPPLQQRLNLSRDGRPPGRLEQFEPRSWRTDFALAYSALAQDVCEPRLRRARPRTGPAARSHERIAPPQNGI